VAQPSAVSSADVAAKGTERGSASAVGRPLQEITNASAVTPKPKGKPKTVQLWIPSRLQNQYPQLGRNVSLGQRDTFRNTDDVRSLGKCVQNIMHAHAKQSDEDAQIAAEALRCHPNSDGLPPKLKEILQAHNKHVKFQASPHVGVRKVSATGRFEYRFGFSNSCGTKTFTHEISGKRNTERHACLARDALVELILHRLKDYNLKPPRARHVPLSDATEVERSLAMDEVFAAHDDAICEVCEMRLELNGRDDMASETDDAFLEIDSLDVFEEATVPHTSKNNTKCDLCGFHDVEVCSVACSVSCTGLLYFAVLPLRVDQHLVSKAGMASSGREKAVWATKVERIFIDARLVSPEDNLAAALTRAHAKRCQTNVEANNRNVFAIWATRSFTHLREAESLRAAKMSGPFQHVTTTIVGRNVSMMEQFVIGTAHESASTTLASMYKVYEDALAPHIASGHIRKLGEFAMPAPSEDLRALSRSADFDDYVWMLARESFAFDAHGNAVSPTR
jgi:hypothetical protein